MKYLIATIPGFEDICSLDLKIKNKVIMPYDIEGRIFVETSAFNKLKKRSVKAIYEIIHESKYKDVEQVRRLIKKYKKNLIWLIVKEVPKNTINPKKFRANFKDFFLDKNPDILFRIDILKGNLIISKLVWKNKFKYEKSRVNFSFDPVLAYSIVKLANIKPKENVWDPFCGSGALPIELALQYNGAIGIHGSDLFEKYVDSARINSKEAKVRQFIHFFTHDFFKKINLSVDYIITELPYNLDKKDYEKIYLAIFKKEPREIIIITEMYSLFKNLAKRHGYELLDDRKIIKSKYRPHLLKFKRII